MNPETFAPSAFRWTFDQGVARITLDRPERKNPLTVESYAALRDAFRALVYAKTVKAVVEVAGPVEDEARVEIETIAVVPEDGA